ncbi:bola-like protein [Xylariaceae sp. FL1651]|nr:bola-like protein [Xylariaceae sp. FL1651]
MLCFQCRRIVASAIRQAPAAAQASRINRLPSHDQSKGFVAARLSRKSQPGHKLQYSTASNTATNATSVSSDAALPEKPDYLNDAESAIWDKLAAEFSPTELMVQDISGGCGSMYGIEIASEKFRGANMLKQQRMVNTVLGNQMKDWHGVQLRTKIP